MKVSYCIYLSINLSIDIELFSQCKQSFMYLEVSISCTLLEKSTNMK